MGSSDKFCLRWNDFQTNIKSSFSDMRTDSNFCDVTLTCEGDQKIGAHKVILAASSSFFSNLLKHNQHPHPLFYMRGLSNSQLGAIMDFIYYGEVNIFQEDLDSFLALAEELKLKGLNSPTETSQESEPPLKYPINQTIQGKPTKQKYKPEWTIYDEKSYTSDETDTLEIEASDSIFEERSLVRSETHAKTYTNKEELDATINSMMETLGEPGKYSCRVCGKNINHRGHMISHIEGNHIEGISYSCSLCGKTCRSRESLRMHKFRYHKL